MKVLQILTLALGTFFLLASSASAQIQAAPTIININVNAAIDEIGNGEVKLTIKMNAMQWAGWKDEYGNNPSLFKRDISKQFNQIEVTDFKLDQDDMKRQAVVTIKGKGMAVYQGEGVYEVELDGEMTGGELVDDEFRVTYTEAQGPTELSLIDQRIRLPKGATDIEVIKNSKGEDVLRYELQRPSGGLPWGWIGIVLALMGGGLFFSAGSESRAK